MLHVSSKYLFQEWLGRSRRGQSIVYWEGHLGVDREHGSAVANEIGSAAYNAMRAGKVVLTQRRASDGFLYIATRMK